MRATDCVIPILTAGNSSRLGTPKQLLMFEGRTLLQRSFDEALSSGIGEVAIITGANHDQIVASLQPGKPDFIYNEHWQQGLASSMQAGLSAILTKYPGLENILITLCDRPFVSSALLQEMIAAKETTGKGIAACMYKDTLGVPALFSSAYFDALLSLQGAEGAKKIIAANAGDTTFISFPQGVIDIDSNEDYNELTK